MNKITERGLKHEHEIPGIDVALFRAVEPSPNGGAECCLLPRLMSQWCLWYPIIWR